MLILEAAPRDIFGRKLNKARKTGRVPAVLYGKQVASPMPLFVGALEFSRILEKAGKSTIVSLKVKNRETKEFPVLIYKVQRDPISLAPSHIDFFQMALDEKVSVRVPVELIGESAAVAGGGNLSHNIREVEVRALPLNLPREIQADISVINTFEDVVRIKDLVLPEGAEIIGRDPEDIIAHAEEIKEEKIKEELAAPAAEEAPGEVALSEEKGKKEEAEEAGPEKG